MSPRRRLAAIGLGFAAVGAAPGVVGAHAIGGTYQLPLPLWMYLAGAAVAVAASFVVVALIQRRAVDADAWRRPIPAPLATVARWALRAVGLAWWYGAIVAGFAVGDISPLPAVLLWIGLWVGLPIVAILIGNPWPSLSPFRSTFAVLEWIARRAGLRSLDVGLPYPAWLSRWPAVVLLAIAIWLELIHPEGGVAATVAAMMLRYTLLTLAGAIAFGQVAWLRNAELFEVLLGWFGRIGPIGRRAATPALCDGCTERCDPAHCVDCPECAVAADDSERAPELRPWAVGLSEVRHANWSDAAFIVLALAGVSYDGISETAFGATLLGWFLPPVEALFGLTGGTFLLVDTLAFAAVAVAFLAAFLAVVLATHRVVERPGAELRRTAGAYASTLLPIAAGYLVAHYLTLVILGAVWLPSLLADPLGSLQPELTWIPVGFVWYLSVGSIVLGHVVAIVLAHRIALRDSPRRPVVAGLPMVALMIGYTILSLWIIAQPIVVEPGLPMAAR
ncbi:MAG TPA: hypothetical protein VLA76_01965 [Candidatus Angelobacter sp.]|nr:hypothetical protein [Candidatus Angelobacter sp.]